MSDIAPDITGWSGVYSTEHGTSISFVVISQDKLFDGMGTRWHSTQGNPYLPANWEFIVWDAVPLTWSKCSCGADKLANMDYLCSACREVVNENYHI